MIHRSKSIQNICQLAINKTYVGRYKGVGIKVLMWLKKALLFSLCLCHHDYTAVLLNTVT